MYSSSVYWIFDITTASLPWSIFLHFTISIRICALQMTKCFRFVHRIQHMLPNLISVLLNSTKANIVLSLNFNKFVLLLCDVLNLNIDLECFALKLCVSSHSWWICCLLFACRCVEKSARRKHVWVEIWVTRYAEMW